MPAAPIPPMTTRQAKRAAKKKVGQFEYSASQMRRADRIDELEERRKREEEKEKRKKFNKRKREEQQEKERQKKRKLLEDGKITIEDTWTKVAASQPRLNNFFTNRATRQQAKLPQELEENKQENASDGYDSQEDTLVGKPKTVMSEPEDISDADLLKLLSSPSLTPRPRSTTLSPQKSLTIHQSTPNLSKLPLKSTISNMTQRRRDSSQSEDGQPADDGTLGDSVGQDMVIAEDATATDMIVHPMPPPTPTIVDNALDPPRSALSVMSRASVEQRARDRPDMTSFKTEAEIGLATPSKLLPKSTSGQNRSHSEIDANDLRETEGSINKENADPMMYSPAKGPTESDIPRKLSPSKTSRAPTSMSKPAPPEGFSKYEDCEDLFDFDFETEEQSEHDTELASNFEDDDIDDETLLSMALTQKPKIDPQGSPRKTPSIVGMSLSKASPLLFGSSSKAMPSPGGIGLTEKRTVGDSFTSVDDEALLDLAVQVEDDLSQKSQSINAKGKQKAFGQGAEPKISDDHRPMCSVKTKRRLPWEVNPLPPPSTQDVLTEFADEVEASME